MIEDDDAPTGLDLPLIDMSLKARFQRSREGRIGQLLAIFEKVLLSETKNGLHPEDMAEAARRLPFVVEKIAAKRTAMLNAKKSAEVRSEADRHPDARKLAKQKMAEDPNASKASVARYIRSKWTLKYKLPKDDRALVRLVSAMEAEGELVFHKLTPRNLRKNRT
jgi:hypothetical protein